MGSDIMEGAPEGWRNPKNRHTVSHKVKTCSAKQTPERKHGLQNGAKKKKFVLSIHQAGV